MALQVVRSGTEKDVSQAEFSAFWQNYPRKVGKGAALKAWLKLSETDRKAAILGLQLQAAYLHSLDWQYIPHPSTWLNQWRWMDELPGQQVTCKWTGCSKTATAGKWCASHEMAIKRGETP